MWPGKSSTKCDAPVYLMERDAYRAGLRKAIQGIEEARLALVKACMRIEGQG